MVRKLLAIVFASALCASFNCEACNIIYGKDWSFVSSAPPGWTAACGDDAMDETVLTLWPSDQTFQQTHVVIYVTVSDKDGDTLSSFVKDEVARFEQGAPEQRSIHAGAVQDLSATRKRVHVGNSVGGRDELVEYIEGPTAYYIVVLTTESSGATKQYTPAFDTFLESFAAASFKGGG